QESFALQSGAELKNYGLYEPAYQLHIKSTDGKEGSLSLPTRRARGYGRVGERALVSSFDASALRNLKMPVRDLYNSSASLINIKDINGFKIKVDGEEHVGQVYYPDEDEKDQEKVYILDGKNANVENAEAKNLFNRFYGSLIGIQLEGFDIKEQD